MKAPTDYGQSEGYRLLHHDEQHGSHLANMPALMGIEMWWKDRWRAINTGTDLEAVYRTKLSRAELRAKRGLAPEKVTWIRASERQPEPRDFPINVRWPSGTFTLLHSYAMLQSDAMWVPFVMPAMPEPTHDEKDKAAAKDSSAHHLGPIANSGRREVYECAFLKGVAYARKT